MAFNAVQHDLSRIMFAMECFAATGPGHVDSLSN